MCNVAISTVLMYCIVTLVRLPLVTDKGYLLTYLIIMIIGAATHQAAQHKLNKYSKLASTHIFYPIAIETAGTWDDMAIELIQEIGRRTTVVTQDTRETVFLFQRLSITSKAKYKAPAVARWVTVVVEIVV